MRDYTAPMKPVRATLLAIAAVLSTGTVLSREIPLKAGPSEYLAHAELNSNFSIAADFLGKYLPVGGTTIYSDEYLFVEVAFFGARGAQAEIKPDQFSLSINGTLLTPKPPGAVTEWNGALEMNPRPQVVSSSSESGTFEIGKASRVPAAPVPQDSNGPVDSQGKKKSLTPDEAVKASELPQGVHALPAAGYLFFAFEGKLKKIKHAELLYKGPLGEATLKLR